MARKPKGGGGGAPEWLVTFADLMSLLVCFFVLIISFSNQDEKKMSVVAGSMREAFGSQAVTKRAGMIEIEGRPENPYNRRITHSENQRDTSFETEAHDSEPKQGEEVDTHTIERSVTEKAIRDRYIMAAASLRQALSDLPDVAELSKNVIMHVDEKGLHIELVDQDGRAMFDNNSRYPNLRTEQILRTIAPVLRGLANRVTITGHTTQTQLASGDSYSNWELSADRAEAVRRILIGSGVQHDRIAAVVGKADTEPLFVSDRTLSANRRVTLLLMHEPPPIPADLSP